MQGGKKSIVLHMDFFIQKYSVPSTLTGSCGVTADHATFSKVTKLSALSAYLMHVENLLLLYHKSCCISHWAGIFFPQH